MMFVWLALLAAGAYVTLGGGVSSGYPAGLTDTQVQLAVKNALVNDQSVSGLQGFAQALAPYNAPLAAQLSARALALTPKASVAQKAAVQLPAALANKPLYIASLKVK